VVKSLSALKSPHSNPQPPRLLFSIGGFEAFQFEVELLPSGKVRIQTGWPFTPKPAMIEIPADRWTAFWREVDQIGVWNWKTEYNRMVLDGTSWDLEIAHKGRSLKTYGCNAYPECEDPDGDISYPDGGQSLPSRNLTPRRHTDEPNRQRRR
jgi:hypothetical protein